MNYNLLIADDEELIRKGLIARLEYLQITFQNIYEAATGQEALEILKNYKVDIVVTDIRMPQMGGLELMQEAGKIQKGISFLILSGYAEFEYAKRALELGAKAYLLKPLSNEELKKEFTLLFAQMERERAAKTAANLQNRLNREKREFGLEKELNRFLADREYAASEYPALMTWIPELFEKNLRWYLAIINIEKSSFEKSEFQKKDIGILQFYVKNVFQEIQTECRKMVVGNFANDNQFFGIFWWEKSSEDLRMRGELEKLFLRMQSLFSEQMEVMLSFGVSNPSGSLGRQMVQEAQSSLKQRLVYGKSGIYFSEDGSLPSMEQFPSMELNRLNTLMEHREMGKIRELLKDLFSDGKARHYTPSYLRVLWVGVLNMLLRNFSLSKETQDNTEKILASFHQIDSFETMKEVRESLWELIKESVQMDRMADTDSKSRIRMAIQYIHEHYNENLPVNELAARFDMSPNYFSSIFKKEMNQSAVNYITEYRVQKAREYLEASDWSVVEIARKVGYEDNQYFFRVFKKYTGLTPLQYRQTHRKGKS